MSNERVLLSGALIAGAFFNTGFVILALMLFGVYDAHAVVCVLADYAVLVEHLMVACFVMFLLLMIWLGFSFVRHT